MIFNTQLHSLFLGGIVVLKHWTECARRCCIGETDSSTSEKLLPSFSEDLFHLECIVIMKRERQAFCKR